MSVLKPVLLTMLGVFNLLSGLALLFLGGRYLFAMYGFTETPPPVWIGWFVDDLFGSGISTKSSQAVVWAMATLGASLLVGNIDYLHTKLKP
jgi:hypothetical protein